MRGNFERMLDLVGEFFDVKNDPGQIDVDEKVLKKLSKIHEATISQKENKDGPIAWILVIPTTKKIMQDFLENKISENELLNKTKPSQKFEAVYLCSASVLPEFRNQGLAKQLTVQAIRKIKKNYPVEYLYYWKFSKGGERLAESISSAMKIPLRVKIK